MGGGRVGTPPAPKYSFCFLYGGQGAKRGVKKGRKLAFFSLLRVGRDLGKFAPPPYFPRNYAPGIYTY